MACRRMPITAEQLHAAWVSRRRPDWPATYEATMADPLLHRLVRCMAMGMAQAQAQRQRAQTQWLPSPARQPAQPAGRQTLDRKRLAAGERDDD